MKEQNTTEVEFKNGDKVRYRMGLTFIYIGQDPIQKDHSYCIHPTIKNAWPLPTEDLTPV